MEEPNILLTRIDNRLIKLVNVNKCQDEKTGYRRIY